MKKYIVIFIFMLALFLRTYKLGQYPTGFLWDEPALGYNAYSILKTGADEYGNFLPIIFKSFGDFKPGLYVYLTVPSVAIFGLNEFAVRLPSAFFGSLTVIFLYLLIKEGLGKEKDKGSNQFGFIAALILTLSPWHINFSRGAWELNVMTFEIVSGLYFFIKYLHSKKEKHCYLSLILFILSFFTYQTARLLVPLLVAIIIFLNRKILKDIPKKTKIKFGAIFALFFIIINILTSTGGRGGRLKVMSVFSYPRSDEEKTLILNQDNNEQPVYNLFHNPIIFFTRSILGRYFNYFSEKFLFFSGDWSSLRNGTIYNGVLYIIDFPLLALGFYSLFSKKRCELENFMLLWLFIAPIPAAMTRDSISSVRSFTMVIPFVFIISSGIIFIFNLLQKTKKLIRIFTYCLFLITYCIFFIRFLDLYFIHDPIINAKERLFGYKQMIQKILPLMKDKEKVVITTKYGQPYIFYLFYSKYDPAKYQRQAKLKENLFGDVGEVEKIDNIEFRKTYWPTDRGIANSLFVDDEFGLALQDIVGQKGITFVDKVNYPDGNTAFRIVETE